MTEEEKKEIDLLHKLDVKFNKLSLREHLIVEEATKELQMPCSSCHLPLPQTLIDKNKELQEENRRLVNDYEMIHNCFLINENEVKELEKQNKELQCCQNCKHCNEVKSYKGLGGKEITKVCSDGNYVCGNWEYGRN